MAIVARAIERTDTYLRVYKNRILSKRSMIIQDLWRCAYPQVLCFRTVVVAPDNGRTLEHNRQSAHRW